MRTLMIAPVVRAFLFLVLAAPLASATGNPPASLEAWMAKEAPIALMRMHWNISPPGTTRGTIVASPSRYDPDYYFHWIRDSALVVESLWAPRASHFSSSQTFSDYVALSRELQLTRALTGLGEPRFNINGTPYSGDWARPQNDGPALRILSLLRAPAELTRDQAIQQKISLIVQADLQFIIENFRKPSFDLWEEVKGDHFYTRLVQLSALTEALRRFDPSWMISKSECEATITALHSDLDQHWLPGKSYFSVSLNRIEGAEKYKFTDLDTAVILGVIHSRLSGDKFSVRDERVLATAGRLEETFEATYAVNTPASPEVAPAIGRYSDDVYFGGNPWYITTAAFAELHYLLAASLESNPVYAVSELNLTFLRKALLASSSPENATRLQAGLNLANVPDLAHSLQQGLRARGDLFMARVRLHTQADGGMAEQFSRSNGQPVSARDLTWSYASFLTAFGAR